MRIMLERSLKAPLVCWPKSVPAGAVSDATIVEPGERVKIRENEERRAEGRMPILARGKIVYCSCAEFWKSVK
jgi:hypothetical protein